ncbi:hypothetical protein THRCLA_01948 [Thraustotheca clavata]|uniref:Uncharacterized protein n=1 Tax=Thraustotheca clavata TaxID=74557 RepID=A0A1W0A6Q9_9STRA|nr:hypothetical protein THRCLA_01948 [Thraustotheca clavata]
MPKEDFFSGRGLQFTDDLFKSVEEYIEVGTQQLERNLVQSKGTVVTNSEALAIHKGTTEYMKLVGQSFAKNFDKFELYIMRNVFVTPKTIAETQRKYQNEMDTSFNDAANWTEEDVHSLENELHQLRQQIQTAAMKQQHLQNAHSAVEEQLSNVQQFCASLQFTDGISETVAPFTHQMVSSANSLRDAVGTMRELHRQLECSKDKSDLVAPSLQFDDVAMRYAQHQSTVQCSSTEDLLFVNSKMSSLA